MSGLFVKAAARSWQAAPRSSCSLVGPDQHRGAQLAFHPQTGPKETQDGCEVQGFVILDEKALGAFSAFLQNHTCMETMETLIRVRLLIVCVLKGLPGRRTPNCLAFPRFKSQLDSLRLHFCLPVSHQDDYQSALACFLKPRSLKGRSRKEKKKRKTAKHHFSNVELRHQQP